MMKYVMTLHFLMVIVFIIIRVYPNSLLLPISFIHSSKIPIVVSTYHLSLVYCATNHPRPGAEATLDYVMR